MAICLSGLSIQYCIIGTVLCCKAEVRLEKILLKSLQFIFQECPKKSQEIRIPLLTGCLESGKSNKKTESKKWENKKGTLDPLAISFLQWTNN